jgi:hypothetical protein
LVRIEGTIEEIYELLGEVKSTAKKVKSTAKKVKKTAVKTKHKLTDYQKFMKRELKILKKKHPRMKQPALMKKGARMWRSHKRGKK